MQFISSRYSRSTAAFRSTSFPHFIFVQLILASPNRAFFLTPDSYSRRHFVVNPSYTYPSYIKMATASNRAANPPPSSVVLDRDAYSQELNVVAIRIPAVLCNQYMTKFSKTRLLIPKVKGVYDAPGDETKRLLLLNKEVFYFIAL